MIIRACAFTTTGWKLVDKIEESLIDCVVERKQENKDWNSWLEECFEYGLPILFVGAMGIAVRKIAPYVDSKLTDSPVIVMEENGKYVIPVLSNHLGGANELASILADIVGGQTIVTTATDTHRLFAIDVFAKKNGLKIVNKEGIKNVSARILEGGKIKIAVSKSIEVCNDNVPDCIELVDGDDISADVVIKMPQETEAKPAVMGESLILIFQPYILGIGCKKDTDIVKLSNFISQSIADNDIDESLIAGIASIDLKNKERCILYYQSKQRIPFMTFSAEQLQNVKGEFSESDFVQQITGVSNVCERAAIKMAGDNSKLIVPKMCNNGMTLAISERSARIDIWEM